MDKETKDFFEKLSGINSRGENGDEEKEGEEELEMPPEIAETEEAELTPFDEAEGQLAVDVYETPASFVVKSAIAGVTQENLDIAITNESVTVRGVREEEEKTKGSNYLHQECYWGKFVRTVILPQEIDPDKAIASLKNGVLKISLPKINRSKSKKLKIKFE